MIGVRPVLISPKTTAVWRSDGVILDIDDNYLIDGFGLYARYFRLHAGIIRNILVAVEQ
jgi:hypothetical protein